MLKLHSLVAGLALLCVMMMGCGASEPDHGPLGTVSGKVTYKGQPVTEGTLVMTRDEGGAGAAPLQPDGTFVITDRIGGIPVGSYKIGFEAATKEVQSGPNSPPHMEAIQILPKKYYSTETSGIVFEVKEGPNTLEFEVTP